MCDIYVHTKNALIHIHIYISILPQQFYVKTFPFLSPYIIFEECKCISYDILIRQLKISTTLEQINKVLSQLIIDKSENLNNCVNIFYYTAPKITYATYIYYTIN